MTSSWFALQVRMRMELRVSAMLRAKGYEEFLPLQSPGARSAAEPLFAGYVFCRLAPEACGRFVTTPGVIRVVGFGGRPAPVDPDEIIALQTVDKAKWPIAPCEEFHVGDKVIIEEGPLRGVSGVLSSVRGRHRLLISVQILMRTVAVEITPEWVASLEPIKRHVYRSVTLGPAESGNHWTESRRAEKNLRSAQEKSLFPNWSKAAVGLCEQDSESLSTDDLPTT
jgi:transcription termination/antitermination protein NusG